MIELNTQNQLETEIWVHVKLNISKTIDKNVRYDIEENLLDNVRNFFYGGANFYILSNLMNRVKQL
jgi:hypothetical protein